MERTELCLWQMLVLTVIAASSYGARAGAWHGAECHRDPGYFSQEPTTKVIAATPILQMSEQRLGGRSSWAGRRTLVCLASLLLPVRTLSGARLFKCAGDKQPVVCQASSSLTL